jgi:pimeloyl-ACP methyl ester carboxylesterase
VGWRPVRSGELGPRGTNASDPVRCFTSQKSEARFWRAAQIPTTAAASRAYARRVTALARRCGQVSGELLDHISTADNARDLDYLRGLVGDRQLTYVGLSYGSFLGQTYANMFPNRVRAMLLDSIVDQTAFVKSAEARNTNPGRFMTLCQRAGSARCALAGHPETAAQRVKRLFAQVRRAPIPAPHAHSAGQLNYADLLVTTFTPLRDPKLWPEYARQLEAAANGDASALEDAARLSRTPQAFSKATTSAAIQCDDGPARQPVSAWPTVIRHLTQVGQLWGPVLGWWQWAVCAANWPARRADRYSGPWNHKTKSPILLTNNRHDPATGYRNAQGAQCVLGNAVLLTLNDYGHPTYQLPSQCIDNWRARYLVHLTTPRAGRSASSIGNRSPRTSANHFRASQLPSQRPPTTNSQRITKP